MRGHLRTREGSPIPGCCHRDRSWIWLQRCWHPRHSREERSRQAPHQARRGCCATRLGGSATTSPQRGRQHRGHSSPSIHAPGAGGSGDGGAEGLRGCWCWGRLPGAPHMGASPVLRAPAQPDGHSSLVEGEQRQRNHSKELPWANSAGFPPKRVLCPHHLVSASPRWDFFKTSWC